MYWYCRGNIYTCQNFISIVLVSFAIRHTLLNGDLIDDIIPRIDFHDQIVIRLPVRMNRMTDDRIDASINDQPKDILVDNLQSFLQLEKRYCSYYIFMLKISREKRITLLFLINDRFIYP